MIVIGKIVNSADVETRRRPAGDVETRRLQAADLIGRLVEQFDAERELAGNLGCTTQPVKRPHGFMLGG